jgi:hypothetical protein
MLLILLIGAMQEQERPEPLHVITAIVADITGHWPRPIGPRIW